MAPIKVGGKSKVKVLTGGLGVDLGQLKVTVTG